MTRASPRIAALSHHHLNDLSIGYDEEQILWIHGQAACSPAAYFRARCDDQHPAGIALGKTAALIAPGNEHLLASRQAVEMTAVLVSDQSDSSSAARPCARRLAFSLLRGATLSFQSDILHTSAMQTSTTAAISPATGFQDYAPPKQRALSRGLDD
jgi:hypothetical protein